MSRSRRMSFGQDTLFRYIIWESRMICACSFPIIPITIPSWSMTFLYTWANSFSSTNWVFHYFSGQDFMSNICPLSVLLSPTNVAWFPWLLVFPQVIGIIGRDYYSKKCTGSISPINLVSSVLPFKVDIHLSKLTQKDLNTLCQEFLSPENIELLFPSPNGIPSKLPMGCAVLYHDFFYNSLWLPFHPFLNELFFHLDTFPT